MIKILLVDDSKTEKVLLKGLIEAESDMTVIGEASNGREAVEMCEKLKPDLITMDINMPILDGFDATRLIMSQTPIPVVIISSNANNKAMNATFMALEAGAVSILQKPTNIMAEGFDSERKNMIDTLRSMAQIKVVKRRFNIKHAMIAPKASVHSHLHLYEIVAFGSSIGGPQALHFILRHLPEDFAVPIVIVQHMTPGFIKGFAHWLDINIPITVKVAEENEKLEKGHVYFAPDNHHLTVVRHVNHLYARLISTEPVSGFKPSATVLLESVAKTCGSRAVGAILTGMGNDGAKGLLDLRNNKGTTFIQDSESAIVFGMAGVAQSLGAAEEVINLEDIPNYLMHIIK